MTKMYVKIFSRTTSSERKLEIYPATGFEVCPGDSGMHYRILDGEDRSPTIVREHDEFQMVYVVSANGETLHGCRGGQSD